VNTLRNAGISPLRVTILLSRYGRDDDPKDERALSFQFPNANYFASTGMYLLGSRLQVLVFGAFHSEPSE
jgi:hypothetical protein